MTAFRLIRNVLGLAGSLCGLLPAAAHGAMEAGPAAMADTAWNLHSPLAAYTPFLNHDTTMRATASAQEAGYA